MDTTLKEMPLLLKSSLHADIASLIQRFTLEVRSIGEQVYLIEKKKKGRKSPPPLMHNVHAHEDNTTDHA